VGEIPFDEYDRSLDGRAKEMRELRERSRIDRREPRDIALEFGPCPTAWQNAVHGFRFALLLAAPWIVLGLLQIMRDPNPDDYYPMWSLALSLIVLPLKWGLYGAFLGYFYPLLRGRSGLEKGFFLFIAVVVPTLPLAAIGADTVDGWRPMLIWSLQVFLHCMLLGLFAFDFATLRRSGYRDWRLLFAVHDMPALGISVSSMIVALGAIITTALTSQAAEMVTAVLGFFLPAAGHGDPGLK
jgi:hypothetical protein